MRWTRGLAVFAAATLFTAAGVAGCGDDDSADEASTDDAVAEETIELPAEAATAYDEYTAAALAADGDAMLAFVTDDFTFLSYGTDVQERDFRADYVTQNYGNFQLEEIGDRVVVGGGSEYIVAIPERATTPLVADGISVVKLVEVDGNWLVQSHRFLGEGSGSG